MKEGLHIYTITMMVLAKEIHKAGKDTWLRLAGLDDHISQSAGVHYPNLVLSQSYILNHFDENFVNSDDYNF